MTASSIDRTSLVQVQQAVVTMWRRVLQVETVELEDDFFYLGGDSLKAVELMMSVDEVFGISLDPVEILEQPTAQEFAAIVFELLNDVQREAESAAGQH